MTSPALMEPPRREIESDFASTSATCLPRDLTFLAPKSASSSASESFGSRPSTTRYCISKTIIAFFKQKGYGGCEMLKYATIIFDSLFFGDSDKCLRKSLV